jgi:microcystin-dependent protein
MADPFLGEIRVFAGNFAPNGWALCQGQLLAIAQNTALFSILGTTYGGDGVRTFALPDLRGRVVMGLGQGPGLSNYVEGEVGGAESVTLTTQQMPAHSHTVNATEAQSTTDPKGAVPANTQPPTPGPAPKAYGASPDGKTTMNSAMIGLTGGNQPVSVQQPYLVINYIIALLGIFPSRQ